MAKDSMIDNDLGMEKILEEMKKLGTLYAKVGFPEGTGEQDGVSLAQIASWNENGITSTNNVLKKGKLWEIPARPFMAQAVDNNIAHITKTGESLVKKVADGKIDAVTAQEQQAIDMILLIQKTITNGDFKKNSDITIYGTEGTKERVDAISKSGKKYKKTVIHQFIKGKKSTKPLIDTSTMKKSVNAVILENGVPINKVK